MTNQPDKANGYLALVRDRRLIRNLPPGRTQVRFTGVPSGILPDTVRLRSLDDPEGLTILEQNYQYDLASASAVLDRYIDRPVAVTFKDGKSAAGGLLSFDAASLVIRPAGEGPRTVARDRVRDIAFQKLPEGLLTRPTLVWELLNGGPARQQFEVAYLTRGIMWRADYVLKLHPAEEVIGGEKPEITDTADLVGYATVTNNSGVTFADAELKLLAGDVNLSRPPMEAMGVPILGKIPILRRGFQFQEKSFFEYHLYTLGRATTIRNRETKQIELVSGSGIRMPRRYVYDPHRGHKTSPRVISELMNSEDNGLGRPLPKGTVRLYAPDPEGVQTYISQTTIDHTPKNEKISFQWGHAFDIVCSYTQTEHRREGSDHHETCLYEIRNHKDRDITVFIIARMDKSTYRADCKLDGKDHPWYVREVGLVEIEVRVEANSARTVTFTHSYNPASGGGLSPTMRKGTTTRMASPP